MRTVIIIVCWQSGPHLAPTIASAVEQAGPEDHIVVWDNASGMATQNALDALSERFPSVAIHRHPENLGFAGGNNAAADLYPDTEALFTLNPDAELKPGALEAMKQALRADSRIGAVGAIQLSADEQKIDGLGDVVHVSGLAWRDAYNRPAGNIVETLQAAGEYTDIFSPCAAAALYRRSAFKQTGGFDEDYFCYCEDNDLGMRLQLSGWRCIRANQAVVLHQGSMSTGRDSDFSVYHGQRNLVWTFVKNLPAPLLILLTPIHILMTGLVVMHYGASGRARLILRSKRDALAGLRHVIAKRRAVQMKRAMPVSALWRALDKSVLRR